MDVNTSKELSTSVPTDLTVSDCSESQGDHVSTTPRNLEQYLGDLTGTSEDIAEAEEDDSQIDSRDTAAATLVDSRSRPRRGSKSGILEAEVDYIPKPRVSYNQLVSELSNVKIESTKATCKLEAELKVRSNENMILRRELTKALADLKATKGKLNKLDVHVKELQDEKTMSERNASKRIYDLTLELQEKTIKLETLEKIHSRMDRMLFSEEVIAEPEEADEFNVEKILSSYGYSGSGSVNLKVKLQQSLDLAQRLKEEREHLERNRVDQAENYHRLEEKYNNMILSMNEQKLGDQSKIAETAAKLQVKTFELQRMMALFGETENKLKSSQAANETLKSKIESLTSQAAMVRSELSQDISRLTLALQEKSSKLDVYLKLEDDIDEMVVQAANVPDSPGAEGLLEFCAQSKSLPSNPGRRLQQAFQLAKKVVQLEKEVADQKIEIFQFWDERETLRREIELYKDAAKVRGEPTANLVSTIVDKNREIGKLSEKAVGLEKQVKELDEKNSKLLNEYNVFRLHHQKMLEVHCAAARREGEKDAASKLKNNMTGTTNQSQDSNQQRSANWQRCGKHERLHVPPCKLKIPGRTGTSTVLCSTEFSILRPATESLDLPIGATDRDDDEVSSGSLCNLFILPSDFGLSPNEDEHPRIKGKKKGKAKVKVERRNVNKHKSAGDLPSNPVTTGILRKPGTRSKPPATTAEKRTKSTPKVSTKMSTPSKSIATALTKSKVSMADTSFLS